MLGIAALISLINTGYPYYGASVLNAAMARDLGIERSVLGLGFTLMLLIQGLCGPAIAGAMRRLGIRTTIVAGSVLLACGAALMALWVDSGWRYLLAFGLVVGIGTGMSTYIPTQTLMAQWFVRRRALAFATVIAAGGLGGFIISPLLGALLAHNGGDWRSLWWLVLVCVLAVALLSSAFVRERAPAVADAAQAVDTPSVWTARALLRTPLLWILILGELAVGMPIMSFFAHGVAHLRDIGNDAAQAALALGLMAGASIAGNIAAGVLGDRVDPRYVCCGALLAVAAGVLLAIGADNAVQLHAFAILLGTGYGAGLICKPAMIGRYFGSGPFALVMGTMAPISMSLAALAPSLLGLSYDFIGNYRPGLTALTLLALVAAVAQLFARTPRPAAGAAGPHRDAGLPAPPQGELS